MADLWNDNIPVATNTIAAEILDMEQNFGWLRRLVRMTIGWKDSTIGTVSPPPHRARFRWKDADEIYIDPGVYFLDGTTRQVQFWDATITFQFGSAGSNAGSSDLGTSEWHYLYIDDSTMADGTSEITAATKFINSTTAPSWSDSKHGWYNSADLCIFACLTNSSDEILEFYHDNDFVSYGEGIADQAATDIGSTFTDVTLTVPTFVRRAEVTFLGLQVTGNTSAWWRVNGSSCTTGHYVYYIHADSTYSNATLSVILDSNLKFELSHQNDAGTSTTAVYTNGWYFPKGM